MQARANATCPDAVRGVVAATFESPSATFDSVVTNLNLCGIPPYIVDGGLQVLQQELGELFSLPSRCIA